MAIKEVIKTIEFYRQTAVDSPMYADLIKDRSLSILQIF